jgi:hypothetical protein
MPIEPSVMIQVFSALALRLAAISASAPPLGPVAEAGRSEGAAPGPPKFPERGTLNFFSILLTEGLKLRPTPD